MAITWQTLYDPWRRCDPLIRLFICISLGIMVWRIGVAVVAFPSVKLNFNDYVWMTQFFGLSGPMYLTLVFLGFGLIPGSSSAVIFGCIVTLAAGVGIRVTRNPLVFQLVICGGAIIATAFAVSVSPSLELAAAEALPTLIEGASVPGWIPLIVEYAFGITLCLVMGRKYVGDMSRRMRKRKTA